jgi:hypothetical protein
MHLNVTATSDRKRRIPADVNRLTPRSTPIIAVPLRAVPGRYIEGDLALHVIRENRQEETSFSELWIKMKDAVHSYMLSSRSM